MKKIPHTTVVLSEFAQAIKEDLAPVFGLKNILSAGLLLFNSLSADEQKMFIAKALGRDIDKASYDENVAAKIASRQRRKIDLRNPSETG